MAKQVKSIKAAQDLVKDFARNNGWQDLPNIDRFDHLHEELIEMTRHLRYKSEAERIACIQEEKEVFMDGIGDLFFGLCRLANELNIDIKTAFNLVKDQIIAKYANQKHENKLVKPN